MKTYGIAVVLHVQAEDGGVARRAVESFMTKALQQPGGLVLEKAAPVSIIRPIDLWCDEDVKAAYIEVACDLRTGGNCACKRGAARYDEHDTAPWDALAPSERDAMVEEMGEALLNNLTTWDMLHDVALRWASRKGLADST